MRVGAAYVMAAPDPVACWGAAELMRREFGLPITAITGPATDNEVGQVYITGGLGLPAHNARRDAAGCWRWCARSLATGRSRPSGRRRVRRRPRRRSASRSMKVAVIGAAGYAGGELLRLLLQHPEVTRVRRHQPEPGRQADRRGASGAGAASPTPASPGATPGEIARGPRRGVPLPRARRVVAGGRRGVRRRARAGGGPRGRLPGARSARSTSATTAPTPRPSWCRRFRYGLADVARRRRSRGARPSRRPAASPPRRSSRSIRWRGPGSTSRPSLFAVTGSSGAGVQPKPTTHHPDAGAQPLRLLGAGPPARGRGAAVVARVDRPARRHRAADDALGAVRARHLSHAARVSAARVAPSAPAIRAPRRRAGSARPTRTGRSSACSTRRPSSPTPWAPTTR